MSAKSKIEWTNRTWNPQHGCNPVSAGCANCYAIKEAYIHGHNTGSAGKRFQGLTVKQSNGVIGWTGGINFHEDRLLEPLKWRKPQRVFVNSMSDTFHEDVPVEWIYRLFAIMASARRHTFQILTKRPWRMEAILSQPDFLEKVQAVAEGIAGENGWCHMGEDDFVFPFPNIWLGTSVENQETADERIPHLLETAAAVRFLSIEPLLGPVDLLEYITDECPHCEGAGGWGRGDDVRDCSKCEGWARQPAENGVDWIITGGESGPKARPAHPEWFRKIRDDANIAGVAFFHKQNGEFIEVPEREMQPGDFYFITRDGKKFEPYPWKDTAVPMRGAEAGRYTQWRDVPMRRVGKKVAGRKLDSVTYSEFPEGAS